MHANNSGILADDEDRCRLFKRQLSNRALRARKTWNDEMKDFVSWIVRDPGTIGGYRYGPMAQGFWYDFDGGHDGWEPPNIEAVNYQAGDRDEEEGDNGA